MRLITVISCLFLVSALFVSAQAETFIFNFSEIDKVLTISGSDETRKHFSSGSQLPVEIYYLPVSSTNEVKAIASSYAKPEAVNISGLSPKLTALDENQYSGIAIDQIAPFPSSPFEVNRVVSNNNRLYAEIFIHPIFRQNEVLFLIPSITLSINDQEIRSDDLITFASFQELRVSDRTNPQTVSSTIPKYLIVTSTALQSPFEKLVRYKTSLGYDASIALIDTILTNYPGIDDAARLRSFLAEYYSDGGRFVLLGGDENILPVRYAYPINISGLPSIEEMQLADLYFADVTGNWDIDNDGVYGEKFVDSADITAELWLGRLPLHSVTAVNDYIDKVIAYESGTNSQQDIYHNKMLFFSSDEMRDFQSIGQHTTVSTDLPAIIQIDTVSGVEQSSGDDLSPSNAITDNLESIISQGYGFVNILAHGNYASFGVRSSGYNQWPKSYFTTDNDAYGHAHFTDLTKNGNTSFYYSLACDNGAFDKDSIENITSLTEQLLGLPDAGAVGMVAHSRWGWVGSSHLLMKAFYNELFEDSGCSPAEALDRMKQLFPYYLDQLYGINYYGDPSLKIHRASPRRLSVIASLTPQEINFMLQDDTDDSQIFTGTIIISNDTSVLATYPINSAETAITNNFQDESLLTYTVIVDGYFIVRDQFYPSIATDIDNDVNLNDLPLSYSLNQNYPNPFNPSTTIRFELPRSEHVSLIIYNVLGQEVTRLFNNHLPAGRHEVTWDCDQYTNSAVSSGMYFYRLTTESYTAQKKMLLIR